MYLAPREACDTTGHCAHRARVRTLAAAIAVTATVLVGGLATSASAFASAASARVVVHSHVGPPDAGWMGAHPKGAGWT